VDGLLASSPVGARPSSTPSLIPPARRSSLAASSCPASPRLATVGEKAADRERGE
jgi:hypothetical protein